MLTIKNLYQTNFAAFNGLSSTRRKNQLDKINYIENAAKTFEVNLTEVDLTKIFPTNSDGTIAASPKEINKIIANLDLTKIVEQKREEENTLELTGKQAGDIKRAATTIRNRDLRVKQDRLAQLRSEIDRLSRGIQEYSAQALILRRDLEGGNDAIGEEYVKQVARIVGQGNFKLESVNSDSMVFSTKNDIICTHKNPRAGINLRVNLGKFSILVRYADLQIRIMPLDNNVGVDGHTHPHVSSSNTLCLGNMSDLYSKAHIAGNIADMLDITYKILTNYNNENPYVGLADFARESKQIQPTGKTVEEDLSVECSECGHMNSEGQSECEECDYTLN